MINQEIIKILKVDIQELRGYKTDIIKGLSLFGVYEVVLMVNILEGDSIFRKSIRIINFKTEIGRNNFLNLCKKEGL